MITKTVWSASDLRLTPAQAEFLMTGDVRCVSPKVAARTEDSLSRRKMLTWTLTPTGYGSLRANAKGEAALGKYRNRKLVAANDNHTMEAEDAA